MYLWVLILGLHEWLSSVKVWSWESASWGFSQYAFLRSCWLISLMRELCLFWAELTLQSLTTNPASLWCIYWGEHQILSHEFTPYSLWIVQWILKFRFNWYYHHYLHRVRQSAFQHHCFSRALLSPHWPFWTLQCDVLSIIPCSLYNDSQSHTIQYSRASGWGYDCDVVLHCAIVSCNMSKAMSI